MLLCTKWTNEKQENIPTITLRLPQLHIQAGECYYNELNNNK